MIYSDAFEVAPQSVKDRVYELLWDILSPETALEGFRYIEEVERGRIFNILSETKEDLPDYWIPKTAIAQRP